MKSKHALEVTRRGSNTGAWSSRRRTDTLRRLTAFSTAVLLLAACGSGTPGTRPPSASTPVAAIAEPTSGTHRHGLSESWSRGGTASALPDGMS